MRRTCGAAVLATVVLAACSGSTTKTTAGSTSTTPGAAEASAAAGTPITEPSTTTTGGGPSTTAAAAPAATTAAPAATLAACAPVPARIGPDPKRPSYVVTMAIDAGARRATGSTQVDFTPDLATDRIVLRLWPAAPPARAAGGGMEPGPITVDGATVTAERPDPTTVVVRRPLAAGVSVRIALPAWAISIPTDVQERWSMASGAVRLGTFSPLLPWEPGHGWATEGPTKVHGEAVTSPAARWDLRVTAVGGADKHPLEVLSGGTVDPADPSHRTFDVERDIAVAAGTFRYVRRSVSVAGRATPIPVVVGVDAAVKEGPDAYADKAVTSIQQYSQRFGPYAFPGYTLALTSGLTGGIEYPGFVFQGPGSIGRSTSHEIGHEWFYALVGNDQARDPWLDEGLATWAEAGYEGTLASFKSRDIPADARGKAGSPTSYYDSRTSSYYRGVYVQGTQAVGALGPANLVDCALARYVALNAHRIARNADLLDAITPTFPNAAAVLARYGISRS